MFAHAPPMNQIKLTAIKVSHFKSLDAIEITDIEPVTVLVGSNAVGKSNIVNALRFVRDIVKHGLEDATLNQGGVDIIKQYSKTKPYKITITLEFENISSEMECEQGFYELCLSKEKNSAFVFEYEKFKMSYVDLFSNNTSGEEEFGMATFIRTRDKKNNIFENLDFTNEEYSEININKDMSILSNKFSSKKDESSFFWNLHPDLFLNFIENLHFLNLYPNTLKIPNRPANDKTLRDDGSNWASVIRSLRKTESGKTQIEKLLELMKKIMPSLQDVVVLNVGGYLVPKFRVKDSVGAAAHDFDPIQLSDGTLRTFAILLSIYQKPAPSLIVIEEPEQTINPGILGVLVDALNEISVETQVIITSHSPNLVNLFEPYQIRVVHMNDGKTIVSKIKKSQMKSLEMNLMTIGDFTSAEGLQPELDTL